MTLEVRRVGPESAGVVLAVVRAAFSDRPVLDPPADALGDTEESMAGLLAERGGLVALLDGQPVGSLVLTPRGSTMYLRRFGVTPAAQGHGVAGELVGAALVAAAGSDRVAVLAREELPETIRFWERQSFVEVDVRPPYLELARPLPRVHDVPTADDMHRLGAEVAATLRAGDLLLLTGDLGAGKTTFTQGIGAGLGVRGAVTSPTFVIARVHPALAGGPGLVHVDAYRLGGLAEVDDLDLDTSLDESVTVVEWGEGLVEGLADSRLEVRISRASVAAADDGLDPRRVEVLGVGPRWAAPSTALLLVDVQHGFVTGALGVARPDELLGALQALLDEARAAGRTVVHLQDVGIPDFAVPPATSGRELVFEPLPGEPVVTKTEADGFAGTDLEGILRRRGVTALTVGGVHTDGCVTATVSSARARGFTVDLPDGAHAGRPGSSARRDSADPAPRHAMDVTPSRVDGSGGDAEPGRHR
ncbi:MAG: tRNA (adenosine(37)-N6)-threonylcarbamoyltransferase complex ATPase subunit type 1 TsaE [Nocardioides sp.]